MDDIGIDLYKGTSAVVKIDDIFVYPRLKVINQTDKEWDDKYISNLEIVNCLYNNKILLISGEEGCGKTILAKKIVKDIRYTNKLPLLVTGDNLTTYVRDNIMYLVKMKFCDQYPEDLYDQYIRLPREKRVLVIDDMHLCKLNSDGLKIVLDVLIDIFGFIMIFCNENFRINRFLNKDTVLSYSELFSCVIMPFSCKKRDELIEKWIILGQEYMLEKEQINEECLRKGDIIDNIIGTGWIPSFPGYILLILQQLEMNISIDTKMSSHGYLYQYMINRQLSRIGESAQEINIYDEILINIARYMFERDTYQISDIDIESILKKYNIDYKMGADIGIIDKLIKGNLLDVDGRLYFFKHKYIFYYFTALYLHSNRNEEIVKNCIFEICSRLYSEKYANILIFLCHISKDKEIIEEIIYRAFEIFDGIEPYDFLNHKKFIASVDTGLKSILLPETSVDENRRKMLEKREKLEQDLCQHNSYEELAVSEAENKDECLEPVEIMLFNKAFKTIDIMGQILKNYPGWLKGYLKRDLIMECHHLSMRTLNVFMILTDKAIEEGLIEEIVNMNVESLEMLSTKEKLSILDEYKKKFVWIAEHIATSFIYKVAIPIGDKNLKEAYTEIFRENAGSISYCLLEIAVNLFCNHFIPEQDIIKLSKRFKKERNTFSYEVLRAFIGNYLYLYGCTDFRLKQRLCDELDISSKNLLLRERRQA